MAPRRVSDELGRSLDVPMLSDAPRRRVSEGLRVSLGVVPISLCERVGELLSSCMLGLGFCWSGGMVVPDWAKAGYDNDAAIAAMTNLFIEEASVISARVTSVPRQRRVCALVPFACARRPDLRGAFQPLLIR